MRLSRSPETIARDETFWFGVQQAFTVDRSLINLNNGGVCPSPKVVQDAVRRYLEYSNQAPAYHMWRHLEPMIEGEMFLPGCFTVFAFPYCSVWR